MSSHNNTQRILFAMIYSFSFLILSFSCYSNFRNYSELNQNMLWAFEILDINPAGYLEYKSSNDSALNYFFSFVIQDFLWQCSMTAALLAGVKLSDVYKYIVVCIVMGVAVEIVQSLFFSGTFDIADILAIFIATPFTALILYKTKVLETGNEYHTE